MTAPEDRMSSYPVSVIRELPLFIKWAGGKTQLLPQLVRLLPPKFHNYYEPFIGSGALFFYIQSTVRPEKAVLSDINEELINCFKAVRDNLSELIDMLVVHRANHSKEYFYRIRALKTQELNKIERAARLIYLNKTCFNGLYRVNSKGEFNVPFGDYKNPRIFDQETLTRASNLLEGVNLEVRSFESVVDFAGKHDFVYFDPPYMPISKTANFTSYSKEDFSEEKQRRLANIFADLDRKGCYTMLSNSDHPLIKDLYRKFDRYAVTVRAKRMINSVGSKRGAINEIVIRNYGTTTLEDYVTK